LLDIADTQGESSKAVIGYAFQPFFDHDRRIVNTSGTFELPLAKELAPGYLTAETDVWTDFMLF
jgi:hypothetical protein